MPKVPKRSARSAAARKSAQYIVESLERRVLLFATPGIGGIPEWYSASLPELSNGNTIIPDQSSAVSGAVNALAPSPTNANKLFVATVNGGVWSTGDALDTDKYNEGKPSWAPLTDLYPSLSFGAIAYDPTDPSNKTLWAGFARTSSGAGDGEALQGLLKTTNGGFTWVPMATAAAGFPGGLSGNNIASIVPTTQIDPTTKKQVILAATGIGVWRSNDGGSTFSDLSFTAAGGPPVSAAGLPAGAAVSQLIVDPANANQFYAAIPGQGIYRSTNNVNPGSTWAPMNTGLTTPAGASGVAGSVNIKLSIYNAGGTNAVYAGIVYPAPPPPPNGTSTPPTLVFRSTNAGGNWSPLGPPVNVHPGNSQTGNFAILYDRNNANSVYVAGDSQPASPFDANIVQYNPGNNSWGSVVDGGANNTSPHADARDLAWDANGNLLFACDGGVYRMINVGTSNQKWEAPIGNLEAHEVYSVGYIPGAGYIFGNQDTGTPEPQIASAQQSTFTYQDATSADGNVVAVDSTSKPGTVYVYSGDNSLQLFQMQTFNKLYQLQGTTNVALTVQGSNPTAHAGDYKNRKLTFDTTVPFVPPYLLNSINPTWMLMGSNYLYESTDQGQNVTLLNGPLVNNLPDPTTTVGAILPLVYGGTANGAANANLIYAATGAPNVAGSPPTQFMTLLVRTSGAGMPTAAKYTTGLAGGPATTGIRAGMADPANYNTLFIVDSNGHVYKSTDGGATLGNWSDVTGDLNNLVTDLRCIVVANIGGKQYLFVGGADGVYFANTAGPTFHWREFGNAMPNVIVKDMHYDVKSDTLYVGTWGRGVWAVSQLKTLLGATPTTLTITGDIDALDENDTYTLSLDPNIPNVLDLKIDYGAKHLQYQFQTTCLDQISIAGGGGNDTYNIQGVPAGVPVTINVGTGNATVHFSNANPSGLVGSILAPVNITGGTGTTVLQIDDSGNGNSSGNANVSVAADAGNIRGLSGSPITYDAGAHVQSVAITTGTGGGDQVNLTTVGVPLDVTDPSSNATFRGDFIDVGNAGSTANINAPITIRSANNFDSINVEDNTQLGPLPIVVDQEIPTNDVLFARFTGAAPAVIRFQFSALNRANISTGIDGNAVDVYGPGDAGKTKRINVQNQPGVTVVGMVLNGGLTATNANGLQVRQNFMGDTTITGGTGVVLDANQMSSLTVKGSATGLTATNNTVGSVSVIENSANATFTGNSVVGTFVATGVPGIKIDKNTLSTLALTNTTSASVTNNTISGGVTVDGGSGADVDGNTMASLTMTGGTADPIVNNNSITGALTINGAGATNVTITNNRAGSFDDEVNATGSITGNDFGWTPPPPPHAVVPAAGSLFPITFNLKGQFTGLIQNNDIHNGTIGVNYLTPASFIGNRVFGNTTGIIMPINDTTNGLGFFAGSGRNDIFNNTTGVSLTGRMQNQHVYSNTTGVTGSGILGGSSLDTANLIETNTTGVDFTGTIQFNRIASNTTAVVAHNAQIIVHNLIYRNTGVGVDTKGSNDIRVVNNTFYQQAGDNVKVDGGSARVELLDNIFQADGGYDVFVADDSHSGFFSDYNDLFTTGTGTIFHYLADFTDVLDLQRDVNLFDLHSTGTTVVNPTAAQPQFANLAADDYRVSGLTGGQRSSSPTIDAGDPGTDLMPPPAYQNLLANPSFESGTASWNVNVGGTTSSANPPPFDGNNYFYAGAVGAGFAEQTVNLTSSGFTAAQLDAQNLSLVFGGRVRAATENPPDQGKIIATFLDGSGNALGAADTVPATNVSDRWELLSDRLHVPIGARSVKYRFESLRESGSTDDSYLDEAFLYVLPETIAPDQGAYGNTASGDLNIAAPHVQLLTPQLHEDWELNQPHTIEWRTLNGGGSAVKIDLYQDGPGGPTFLKRITASTPDTGQFAWIPANFGLTFGTFGLRVQVSLVATPSASDRSVETFDIPENIHTFYVNDGSTTGDQYTTAVGSNRNDGRLPSAPKPLLSTIFEAYALGPQDTVYVDTGSYRQPTSIVISGNPAIGNGQGVTIVGPSNAGATAQIDATGTTAAFDVNNANFVTLSHLNLSGSAYGVWVRNASSHFTGSYLTVTGSTLDGIRLEADSSGNDSLDHVTASQSGRDGISVGGPGVPLTNSVAHDNTGIGIRFDNAGAALLTGDESYNNKVGIQITNNVSGTTATVGATDLAKPLGNRIHDNAGFGINAAGGVLVAGNTVSNTGGAMPPPGATGINLTGGARATENVVFANYTGIASDGGSISNNRVFNSVGTGIYAANSATATGNVSYSNAVGIEGDNSPNWSNNLVYANSTAGIWLHGAFAAVVVSNTIYQPAGDGLRIESTGNNLTFQQVRVRNNIIWTYSGYDLTVTPAAEIGFQSDYNDLLTSGNGQVGLWENVGRKTLLDLHLASFTDANSISADPKFVTVTGADGLLGFANSADHGTDDDFHEQSTAGSFHGGTLAPVVNQTSGLPVLAAGALTADAVLSPVVDRGDPASSFANETSPNGGFINLGAYGNTPQASQSPDPYVLVIRPNGGETLLAGESVTISWRSEDTAGTANIDLLQGSTVVQSIASGVPNSGQLVWTVPTNLTPGGNYFVRITRNGPPTASGTSAGPFTIQGATHTFYVNDSTVQAGDFTTAPGSDANSGLDPAHPKASIRALLDAYNLGAGDTIDVDEGTYILSSNIVIPAANSGVTIRGFFDPAHVDRVSIITRNSTGPGAAVFDIEGGQNVTLDHLSITGGDIGILTADNSNSTGLTISNSNIYGNADYNITLGATSGGATITGNQIHDTAGSYGGGNTGLVASRDQITVTNNQIFNNARTGLQVDSNSTVTGNIIYNNGTGIIADSSTLTGNILHDNANAGATISGNSTVTGNTAYHNIGTNANPQAGFQVYGGTVSGNIAYGQAYGIIVAGGGTIANNLVYNNTAAGISFLSGTTVTGNVAHDNGWGIVGNVYFGGPASVTNNLIYSNTTGGIQFAGGYHTPFVNNTVYQATGDAFSLVSQENQQDVVLHNNILWTAGGYDIRTDANSQAQLNSDYNDLYATGTGQIGLWQNGGRKTLADWQLASLRDASSLSADPLFVNATGGDYHEQSLYGSFHGGSLAPVLSATTGLPAAATGSFANDAKQSPAIDRGDASFSFANEPPPNGGYINIGAYGNTDQASKSPASYVLVTHPNGGENWIAGQTFTITWRTDHPGTGMVDVDLLHEAQGGALTLQANILTAAPNNGQYQWAIPASVPPGSDYVIRITREGTPAASDISDATFSIAAQTHVYYVNDSTVQAGDWTTAPGNDANSGTDPAHPKASITGLLTAYALGTGDTIRVDEGTYNLNADIVLTSAQSGITIQGYNDPAHPTFQAVISRGNKSSGSDIVFNGVQNLTIDHLGLTGASNAITDNYQVKNSNITVSDCEIFGNDAFANGNAVYLLGGADNFTMTNCLVHDNDRGIYISGSSGVTISNNTVFNARGGISVSSSGGVISGNEVHNIGGVGMEAGGSQSGIISISNNRSHDNGGGLIVDAYALATGNYVYNQTGAGEVGMIVMGGEARGNFVYNNANGIDVSSGTADLNRAYNNAGYGMYVGGGATASANLVYSNSIGIQGDYSPNILNNIIYANSTRGIFLSDGHADQIIGNTIYQPAGDAIDAVSNGFNLTSQAIQIRNNIIWSQAGYDINLSDDAAIGFISDYNDLMVSGAGKVAKLSTADYPTLGDWAFEYGYDVHSLSTDPQFLNPAGPDGNLGYVNGTDFGTDDNFHLKPTSPAIDAGDPLSSFLSEPAPNGGRINLGNFGNTPQADPSAAQLVQVTVPSNTQKLEAGHSYTLAWRTAGISQNQPILMVDSGGPTVGNWTADAYGFGDRFSRTVINPIDTSGVTNPAPQQVYQTFLAGFDFGYNLPVPDGNYTLRLHFIDDVNYLGKSVLNVKLNGATVKSNYDVFADAGTAYKATALSFNVVASGGKGLSVELTSSNNGYIPLCALELTAPNPSPVPSPTANLQLSTDNGANWTTIASNQPLDAFGRGTYQWTAGPTTTGPTALFRVAIANTSLTGTSQPFGIYNGGSDYYVNDSSTTGDLLTTAVGKNTNSGKTPDSPLADIQAVLSEYNPGAGATIHVDTGSYTLVHDLTLTAANAGLTIQGPAGATALLDRANGNEYLFDFGAGANNITLDHLSMTNALAAVNVGYGLGATGNTISNNDIYSNVGYSVYLGQGNNNWTVTGNRFHDQTGAYSFRGIGLYSNSPITVTNNTVFNNPGTGIDVEGPVTGSVISGNTVYANLRGIYAEHSTVSNNVAHDNTQTGIVGAIDALLTGNLAYRQTATDAAGILTNGAEARGNVAYDNYNGIVGAFSYYGGTGILDANRSYSNTNFGILVSGSTARVFNNLVYANSAAGIVINGNGGIPVDNNTVYQLVGDALRLGGAPNISARGNILWVEAGYDLDISADSQTGFVSDYNDLYRGTGGSAGVGFWNGAAQGQLAVWQGASSQDAHSIPVDPKFVNVKGADQVLGYSAAGNGYDGGQDDNFYLSSGSPAIDRGYSWSPAGTDLLNQPRSDDPGTTNAGSPRYVPADQGSSLYALTGTAQNWRAYGGYWNYTLPFSFPFYDGTYTSVTVSAEGFLQFAGPDAPNSVANSDAGLIADRRIAPLWDNLRTDQTGNDIYADPSVANQMKFTWKATNAVDNSPASFSVLLFSDGRIRFDYGPGNTNLTPTVGISAGDPVNFQFLGYDNSAALTNANSVLFTLPPGIADMGAYEFEGSSTDATPPTITASTPSAVQSGSSAYPFAQIGLTFSKPLNPIDGSAGSEYLLVGAGPDGTFGTADDVVYALSPQYTPGGTQVLLSVSGGVLPAGSYRLTVNGSAAGIHDASGNLLDGDANGSAGGDYVRIFTITPGGSITGRVFSDANHNGVADSGELGLSGWTVYLDLGNSGHLDPADPIAITDPTGAYTFANLAPGTYAVRQVLHQGYGQTSPQGYFGSVTVTRGQAATGPLFGDVPVATITLGFNYLVTLAAHYNKPGTFADGDLNGDGHVDFKDLVILAANYGHALRPAISATTVTGAARPAIHTAAPRPPTHRRRAGRRSAGLWSGH